MKTHKVLIIALTCLTILLSISMRTGSVGPQDFLELYPPETKITQQDYIIYSSNRWNKFAQQYQSEGKIKDARQTALYSLAADPTNASSLLILANQSAAKNNMEKAQELFALGKKLWPAELFKLAKDQLTSNLQHVLKQKTESLQTNYANFLEGQIKKIQHRHGNESQAKPEIDKLTKKTKQELASKIQDLKKQYSKELNRRTKKMREKWKSTH